MCTYVHIWCTLITCMCALNSIIFSSLNINIYFKCFGFFVEFRIGENVMSRERGHVAGRSLCGWWPRDLSEWNFLAKLMAQTVKHLPTMQETRVQSLGREDPLEMEMTTHSVPLPGKSQGWRNVVGYRPCGLKESDTTEWLHCHF